MKTSDFDYYLPEELIAQTPLKDRTSSRLLVLDKDTGKTTQDHFYNIMDYLPENCVLVINNTKVVPARIIGFKEETGAKIELLILKEEDDGIYECLAKPVRRLHIGDRVAFGDKKQLVAIIKEKFDEGIVKVKFEVNNNLFRVLL